MNAHGTIKSAYLTFNEVLTENRLLDHKWFVEQEINTWDHWVSLPLRRRLWLWRHGFTSRFDFLYDFDAYGPEAYLSPLQRYRLYDEINGSYRYLLDDKLSQHWMLADYPEHRPTAYGYVDDGHVHSIAGTEYDGEPVPVSEWLPRTLRAESKLVFKQLRSSGGYDVFVCEYDGEYTFDGDRITEADLCDEFEDLSGYLVTEYVDQHAYADDLYPHASNTIRLLTVWDEEENELLVPNGVHRMGTEMSRPLDNCSAGGLAAAIDIETGELGPAIQTDHVDELVWHTVHPDTGRPIAGRQIPNWEQVRTTVERIARDNTNIPIIGWDVIVDESGEPVIIEANTGPELDMLQVHEPLLEDDRVRAVASKYLSSVA